MRIRCEDALKTHLNLGGYIISLFLTLIIYHNILSYGFDYDDYHQIRPYSTKEVVNSWRGNWDPTKIERSFYRPVTVTFYALRFQLLEYNTFLYHLLSILMFAFVPFLLFKVLYQSTNNLTLSLLGLVVIGSYPYLAHSAVAWSTNQMHILILTGFLLAWYWMDKVKTRSFYMMYILFIVQIIMFLIKEDGLLLLPTLFLLRLSEKIILEKKIRFQKQESYFWLSSILLLLALILLRNSVLHTLGGYQKFSLANIPKTIVHIVFLTQITKWHSLFTIVMGKFTQFYVIIVTVVGLILMILKQGTSIKNQAQILFSGIIILISFNTLTVFSTKIYQWHMQSLGHSIIIAICLFSVTNCLLSRFFIKTVTRYLIVAFLACGIITLMLTSHILSSSFAPFSYQTLQHDKRVLEWGDKIIERHRKFLTEKSLSLQDQGPKLR